MPTWTQCEELKENTAFEYTTINGVVGLKLINKSNSSKYIFLPAVGYWESTSNFGSGGAGDYWSTTWKSSSNVYAMFFNSAGIAAAGYGRASGLSIRPVK